MATKRSGVRRLVPRVRSDDGTTLIEMLVALSIFGILSTALLGLLMSTIQTTNVSKGRSAAVQLAATYVDETRAEGAVSVSPGRTTLNRIVGGTTYTITRDAQFVARDQAETSCTSPGNPSYLRVRIQVTWPNMGTVKPVESSTVVTPSVGDVDDNVGNVAVSVVDRDGAPLVNVPVTLTKGTSPGAGTSQNTTSEGCAYFAFVAPGTYTASVLKTGYTDIQRRPNPFVTTSVSGSTTATVNLQFDEAATLRLSPDTVAAYPAPSTMGYTLYSTTFPNASKTLAVPGTGANPLVVNNLFPVAAGYQMWAGQCLSNDPGINLRKDPAASPRGGDTSESVSVGKLAVAATLSGAPLTTSATVTATQTTTDTGCPSGQSFTFTKPAGTSALGASLPYGLWNFTVKYNGRTTKTMNSVLLDPTTPTAIKTVTVAY